MPISKEKYNPMQNVSALLLIILLVIATDSCRKSDYEVDHVESIRDNGGGTGTISG